MAQGAQRGEGARQYSIDYQELDKIENLFNEFPDTAKAAVNDVLHSDLAVDMVEDNIQPLLPSSGRHWKGKGAAAASTQPFRKGPNELLTLIVRSKTKYNYLYFPDDGSNTIRHMGNQHFMKHGAESSLGALAELCATSVINEFNKGG